MPGNHSEAGGTTIHGIQLLVKREFFWHNNLLSECFLTCRADAPFLRKAVGNRNKKRSFSVNYTFMQFINKTTTNTTFYQIFFYLDVKNHNKSLFCTNFSPIFYAGQSSWHPEIRIIMFNSFISVVVVVHWPGEARILPELLANLYPVLKKNFTDYEIIVVNNHTGSDFDGLLAPLFAELKHNVFLLNLSTATLRNHAVVAGLDRANGDYTVLFAPHLYAQPDLLLELFQKTQEGNDIVYLRARQRRIPAQFRPFYRLFYLILRRYSTLQLDEKALDTRIISRRALNSLLRLRENLRYMKAIYSMVGYRTAYIETDADEQLSPTSFTEYFRTSLVAITSFTTFLRTMLLWIFIFSFVFLIGVIVNALKVKMTGIDLFGNAGEATPGWTFLVVLISVFFAVTCLNLYIMSIYLSNIYSEIKQRPLYIIESVKRF